MNLLTKLCYCLLVCMRGGRRRGATRALRRSLAAVRARPTGGGAQQVAVGRTAAALVELPGLLVGRVQRGRVGRDSVEGDVQRAVQVVVEHGHRRTRLGGRGGARVSVLVVAARVVVVLVVARAVQVRVRIVQVVLVGQDLVWERIKRICESSFS